MVPSQFGAEYFTGIFGLGITVCSVSTLWPTSCWVVRRKPARIVPHRDVPSGSNHEDLSTMSTTKHPCRIFAPGHGSGSPVRYLRQSTISWACRNGLAAISCHVFIRDEIMVHGVVSPPIRPGATWIAQVRGLNVSVHSVRSSGSSGSAHTEPSKRQMLSMRAVLSAHRVGPSNINVRGNWTAAGVSGFGHT